MNQQDFINTSLRTSLLGRSLLGFWREFLWVALFSLFANVLTLSPTLYMLQIFDRVMMSQSELTLITVTFIITIFVAAMAFAEWVRSRLLVRAGIRFDEQLNNRIFLASFQANLEEPSVELSNHFLALTRLRQFVTGTGIIALFDMPWIPVYLGVLFAMHPMLGWTGIMFTTILIIFSLVSSKLTSNPIKHANNSENNTNNFLTNKLRNAEVVYAMGMLNNLKDRWLTLYQTHANAQWYAQERSGKATSFLKFLQYSQQSLILTLGAWLAIRGELTLGAMIASNVLMGNALRPIGVISATWKEFVLALQSYRDIDKLLLKYPEKNSMYFSEKIQGQIRLNQLCAFAPNGQKLILDHIDAQFEPGEVIGIVGPSGAGKSTLARCLIGIWPRTSGQVLLDGVEIQAWSTESLGPHIGYLPQDIELFEGTVAENICRFSDLDSADIIHATKKTNINEIILSLPAGYDTPIGIAGKLLSAGQRQRLALARAIYQSPDLIVLDEPNANLDDVGEASLEKVIRELKSDGKTIFMVLHTRNLLTLCDRVIEIENGRITRTEKPTFMSL
jgi:ATP-binding cassette subfamily C exporter for protease/lipase